MGVLKTAKFQAQNLGCALYMGASYTWVIMVIFSQYQGPFFSIRVPEWHYRHYFLAIRVKPRPCNNFETFGDPDSKNGTLMLRKCMWCFVYIDRAQTEHKLNPDNSRGIYFTCCLDLLHSWMNSPHSTLNFPLAPLGSQFSEMFPATDEWAEQTLLGWFYTEVIPSSFIVQVLNWANCCWCELRETTNNFTWISEPNSFTLQLPFFLAKLLPTDVETTPQLRFYERFTELSAGMSNATCVAEREMGRAHALAHRWCPGQKLGFFLFLTKELRMPTEHTLHGPLINSWWSCPCRHQHKQRNHRNLARANGRIPRLITHPLFFSNRNPNLAQLQSLKSWENPVTLHVNRACLILCIQSWVLKFFCITLCYKLLPKASSTH